MKYSKNPNNAEVRKKMRITGIRQWQVADAMEVSENTLCRMLRYELPDAKKQEMLSLIDSLAREEA